MGVGVELVGNGSEGVVFGAVLPQGPARDLQRAVAADQDVRISVPLLVNYGRLDLGEVENAGEQPGRRPHADGLGRLESRHDLTFDDVLGYRPPNPVLVAFPFPVPVGVARVVRSP